MQTLHLHKLCSNPSVSKCSSHFHLHVQRYMQTLHAPKQLSNLRSTVFTTYYVHKYIKVGLSLQVVKSTSQIRMRKTLMYICMYRTPIRRFASYSIFVAFNNWLVKGRVSIDCAVVKDREGVPVKPHFLKMNDLCMKAIPARRSGVPCRPV
jgi:hypothetical protein